MSRTPWHWLLLLASCTIAAAYVFALAPTRRRDKVAITIASFDVAAGGPRVGAIPVNA